METITPKPREQFAVLSAPRNDLIRSLEAIGYKVYSAPSISTLSDRIWLVPEELDFEIPWDENYSEEAALSMFMKRLHAYEHKVAERVAGEKGGF